MRPTATLDQLVARSSEWSCLLVKHMIAPERVAAVLNRAGVAFVLVGAHAVNAWTRRVRATMDVDLVVASRAHRKAVKAIHEAFPDLKAKDRQVVTRFLDPASGEVVIDLMKPKDDLLKVLFDHTVTTKIAGEEIPIPDLEMTAAMKFAAMIGVYRKRADKIQDGADFARIVDANPKLDVPKLERLGGLVYQGGNEEIRRLVAAIREGKPLVF